MGPLRPLVKDLKAAVKQAAAQERFQDVPVWVFAIIACINIVLTINN
jgi:hypothetical protein